MTARQTGWPRCWLMTDERMGERLWEAIERLPIGDGGVVVRHYALPPTERAVLAERIAAMCRKRGLTLAVAKDEALAVSLGAELLHRPEVLPATLPFSRPVHSLAEAQAARAEGASLVFVSPVHETRSHPDARPLGRKLARQIVKACGCPAIALGGMDARKFATAEKDGFSGWAAIDAWIRT
jgi:thiamine-phosphate pyrophosphorylase